MTLTRTTEVAELVGDHIEFKSYENTEEIGVNELNPNELIKEKDLISYLSNITTALEVNVIEIEDDDTIKILGYEVL